MRQGREWMDVVQETELDWCGENLPIYSITMGSREADAPSLLLTAGVHGIERIGTEVLLSWLQVLLERLRWDKNWQRVLQSIQLVLVPIVNPVGMVENRRANGAGVDLNRSCPVTATEPVPWLGGGHRISRHLPWYRGAKDDALMPEVDALQQLLQRQLLRPALTLSMDLHSGFGLRDSIWLPYAHRRDAIDNISAYVAFKLLWERGYPQHNYVVEPQSNQYLSHGDLWDYFYLYYRQKYQATPYSGGATFLPLTLEMGSWSWVRKRPQQLLTMGGLFNPQKPHRRARVLRRHIMLFDFLCAAVSNSDTWLPQSAQLPQLEQMAQSLWFKTP